MSRSILVYGATGKQGGALIQGLLDHNADFRILALTRDTLSASAKRLAAKSAKISLIQGSMDDPDAIFSEAEKISAAVWGVFCVLTVDPSKEEVIVEEHRGKKLVDSAIKHGVQHFVYSSSGRGGDQPTDVPHFATKHNVEKYLIACASTKSMTWTILRPVAFMENFDGTFFGKVFATGWRDYVKSRRLQLVATADIGRVGAKVFLEAHAHDEEVINIVGDELTFSQMASVWKETKGTNIPTTFGFVVMVVFWMAKDLRLMYEFFEKEGFGVDLDETRKILPQVQDFKTWLNKSKNTQ